MSSLHSSIAYRGPAPTPQQMARMLRRAQQIALRSRDFGRHPFGAVLVAPDHETILLEQGNVSTVNHAESVLARTAEMNFPPDYLWQCTLATTVEPCAMCAATQYWANIGRLVYGMEERQLLRYTGDHPENPTLDLPSRDLFAHGQKAIEVFGPFPELEEEFGAVHRDFWSR